MPPAGSTSRRRNTATGRKEAKLEKFSLEFDSQPSPGAVRSVLCGVVSSGNLEVLVEAGEQPDVCRVEVNTSAVGFRDIWQAVLADFAANHAAGGLNLAINDAGSTPAVVSLRLAQAFETSVGGPT